jgi:hypothetical protein
MSPATNKRGPVSNEGEQKVVPDEFQSIDFKNFSYPVIGRRRNIQLTDGKYDFENDEKPDRGWLSFHDVNYFNATGDGKNEAIVELVLVACGGSCDGGSALFYFYQIHNKKVKLQSRLETGSLGYDCGLKSFVLKKTILTLETFRECRFNGVSFNPVNNDADNSGGKFLTNRFTRFVLRFNGARFVLEEREVFPYAGEDFRGFEPKIVVDHE